MKRKKRPHAFWKDRENVKIELARVTKKLGHFPSWIDLKKIKEHALIQGIRNYHDGSILSFRGEMGYEMPEMKPSGYWMEWKNVRKELEEEVKDLGHFPSGTELRERDRSDILNAVFNYGGIIKVRKRMGYKLVNHTEEKRQEHIKNLEEKLGEPLEDFLIREYGDNRRSSNSLASELKTTQLTVRKWLRNYGIQLRSISESRLPVGVKKPTKNELKEQYVTQRKSSVEISQELGVTSGTVVRWLKKYKIPIRDVSERMSKIYVRRPSKREIEKYYVGSQLSQKAMAEKYETSEVTIRNWLRSYRIPIRSYTEAALPLGFRPPSKKKLEREYLDKERTLEEIAEDLGVSKNKVLTLLKEHGIRRRERTYFTEKVRPSRKKLNSLYVTQKNSLNEIAENFGVSAKVVRDWLMECDIPVRNIAEARIPKGARIPSEDELRKWYVDERKTTVEIGEMVGGIADGTIGNWLRQYGIEVRDRRGIYEDKDFRKKTFRELLKHSRKTPKTITTFDFQNVTREDGSSYSGLLGWYRRNYQCKQGAARDVLLEDLCGLPIGSSIHSRKAPRIRIEEMKTWEDYKSKIEEILNKHTELNGQLPSENWLKENGYSYILRGAKVHGGVTAVREKLGQEPLRKPNGYWDSLDNIKAEINNVLESHPELNGRIPHGGWLNEQGYSDLTNAIRRYGGFKAVKSELKYQKPGPIKTEGQLTHFFKENSEALEIGALASVSESTGDIADILVTMFPDRFLSAADLARSLPGAIKHIGHSLHPFSIDKSRGLYDKIKSHPANVKYALDNLLYSIAIDHYQKQFNQNPETTLEELKIFSHEKNGVSGLAKKVYSYYQEVYGFNIPGQGKIKTTTK